VHDEHLPDMGKVEVAVEFTTHPDLAPLESSMLLVQL